MADLTPDTDFGTFTLNSLQTPGQDFELTSMNGMSRNTGFLCSRYITLFAGHFYGDLTYYGSLRLAMVYMPAGTYLLQASITKSSTASDFIGTMCFINSRGGIDPIGSARMDTSAVAASHGSTIYFQEASGWAKFGLYWTGDDTGGHTDVCNGWIGARRLVGTT